MREVGGQFHLKLVRPPRPIANKYNDGMVKQDFVKRDNYAFTCCKGAEGNQVFLARVLHVSVFACAVYANAVAGFERHSCCASCSGNQCQSVAREK